MVICRSFDIWNSWIVNKNVIIIMLSLVYARLSFFLFLSEKWGNETLLSDRILSPYHSFFIVHSLTFLFYGRKSTKYGSIFVFMYLYDKLYLFIFLIEIEGSKAIFLIYIKGCLPSSSLYS